MVMSNLAPIPKLVDLLEHPELVSQLPHEAVPMMLGELERLRATLWARLTMSQGNRHSAPEGDRLLDVKAAAVKLNVSEGWLYREHGKLPFTVRGVGSKLLFSEAGIEKWIRQRMGR